MSWEQLSPLVSLALNVCSLIGCVWADDYRKAIYWLGAAIITGSMIW